MPCYEVRTISVEFKAENKQVLLDALKHLNMEFRVLPNGRLRVDGDIDIDLERGVATFEEERQDRVNELKRAYSQKAIAMLCRKNLWMNKSQGNKGMIIRM